MTARWLVAAAAAVALSACLEARVRLDVPRVSLVLDDSIVAPGGVVRGTASATDRTGIIFFVVTASTTDSTSRTQLNRIAADSVGIDFELRISSVATPDSPVSIRALARDNQDFEVSITDTVFVRVEGGTR